MRSDKQKSAARQKEAGQRERKDVVSPQRKATAKRGQEKPGGGDTHVRRRDEKTGETLH